MNERMHRIHSFAICRGGGGVYIRMYVCNLNPKQKQQTFDLFYWPDNWNKNKNSATKRRRQARERNQKSIIRKINLLKIKANKNQQKQCAIIISISSGHILFAHTYIHTYKQCSPPLQNVKCYSRGGQGLSPHRQHEKSTLLSITTGEKKVTHKHTKHRILITH